MFRVVLIRRIPWNNSLWLSPYSWCSQLKTCRAKPRRRIRRMLWPQVITLVLSSLSTGTPRSWQLGHRYNRSGLMTTGFGIETKFSADMSSLWSMRVPVHDDRSLIMTNWQQHCQRQERRTTRLGTFPSTNSSLQAQARSSFGPILSSAGSAISCPIAAVAPIR